MHLIFVVSADNITLCNQVFTMIILTLWNEKWSIIMLPTLTCLSMSLIILVING